MFCIDFQQLACTRSKQTRVFMHALVIINMSNPDSRAPVHADLTPGMLH